MDTLCAETGRKIVTGESFFVGGFHEDARTLHALSAEAINLIPMDMRIFQLSEPGQFRLTVRDGKCHGSIDGVYDARTLHPGDFQFTLKLSDVATYLPGLFRKISQ